VAKYPRGAGRKQEPDYSHRKEPYFFSTGASLLTSRALLLLYSSTGGKPSH